MRSFKILHVILIIFFNNIFVQAQELPAIPGNQSWTKSYNDPIELAKKSITELNMLWSPVTYYSTFAVYNVGSFVSIYGGAYVLLESPNLAVDMLNGGLYEVGSTITKDFILNVIEMTVKTPKKSCINISQQLIKNGLDDYKAAYDIVKNYRKTQKLNEEEALSYLSNRWGILKLPIARSLYNDVQKHDYSINHQIAAKTTEELLKQFENNYHRGIKEPNVKIVEAAFFIKDVRNILEQKKLGLQNYIPYQNFEKKMEILNREMIEEKNRLNQTEKNIEGDKLLLNRKYEFGNIEWTFKNGESRAGKFIDDGDVILYASVELKIINLSNKNYKKKLLHFAGNFGGGNSFSSQLWLVELNDKILRVFDKIDFNSVAPPILLNDKFKIYEYERTELDALCCPSFKHEIILEIQNEKFRKLSDVKMKNY